MTGDGALVLINQETTALVFEIALANSAGLMAAEEFVVSAKLAMIAYLGNVGAELMAIAVMAYVKLQEASNAIMVQTMEHAQKHAAPLVQ